MKRLPRAQGSPIVAGDSPRGALSRVCPLCGAQIGWRCFRLKSWIGPPPLIGFFAQRQQKPHPERRGPVMTDAEVRRVLRGNHAGSVVGEWARGDDSDPSKPMTWDQRRRAWSLIEAKLPQNRKGPARQYVNNPTRSFLEAKQFIEKLGAMPDVER